ncbi:hypothetical protein AB0M34_16025 [Nocardia sp. NPDC050193]
MKLEWGQGLAHRVRFAATPDRGSDYVSNIATTLYNPYRRELDSDFAAYTGTENILPSKDTALATTPIRFLNREAAEHTVHDQAVAGWYYIAVKLGERARVAPVPIELEVDVTGEPEPGPRYAGDSASTGTFGADPQQAGAPDTAAAADTAAGGVSPLVWVAVGGAVVLTVAAATIAFLLSRRRRR